MANEIIAPGPVALANARATLERLNNQNTQLQEGELMPAAAGDNPQQPSLSDQFFQMVETQTGYLESIAADIELLVTQFDQFFAQQALDDLRDLESAREEVGPVAPTEKKDEKGKGFLQSIMEWVDNFRRNFLFGLAAALSALTLANFGFTGIFEGKILDSLRGFFSGKGAMFDKLTKVFEKFKPITQVFAEVGSKIGAFFKLVGKFLYPLAVVMSVWDGIKASIESSQEGGNAVDVFNSFVGGFLGSFVGEFINLIKTLVLWPFRKLLADDEGNFDTSTFVGKYLDMLDKLDFNELIRNIFDSVLSPLSKLYTGIKVLGNKLGADFELTEGDKENLAESKQADINAKDADIALAEKELAARMGLPESNAGRIAAAEKLERLKTEREQLVNEKTEITSTMRRSTNVATPTSAPRSNQTQQLAAQTEELKGNSGAAGSVNVNAPTTNNNNSSSNTTIQEPPSAFNPLTQAYMPI